MSEDVVQIPRVADHDSRRQSGDGDLKGIEAERPLALDEPIEEPVARQGEVEGIAQQRQGVWCSTGRASAWSTGSSRQPTVVVSRGGESQASDYGRSSRLPRRWRRRLRGALI